MHAHRAQLCVNQVVTIEPIEVRGPFMSDEYFDRIAELLPEEVIDRYHEIKHAISWHRDELSKLHRSMEEFARIYGVPDIDDPASEANARIRLSLGADAIEINSTWASTPPAWHCPCCQRNKPECARLGSKAQMLGKLVAHHDHIEDFMSVVLSDLSKDFSIEASSSLEAKRFIRRGRELFARFDRIIICEDCNNVEAKAKTLVGADQYFTFTPRELSSFLRAMPNRPHEVDTALLATTYKSAKLHYERRVASLKKLAEYALKGTAWYEPVPFEDREERVDQMAQAALRLFGLDHVGSGSVRDIFFPTQKIDIKHASAWRTKEMPAPRLPTEQEMEFVTRGHPQFADLPEDWICPCCARSKRHVVRWTQNSKQFSFSVRERNISDPSTRTGLRKVTLCDACNHVFQECHKELRKRLGEQSVPDYPVSPDEIHRIILPRPHSLHSVNRDAAQILIEDILSRLQAE